MKTFAPHTPPEVANWLQRQLAAIPGHPVLRALAVDDRMSDLWTMLGSWEPKASLVQLAVHFTTPTILSVLQRPSQERDTLAWSEYNLVHRRSGVCNITRGVQRYGQFVMGRAR